MEAATSPLWLAILTLADILTPIRLEWLACVLALALTIVGLSCAIVGAHVLIPSSARLRSVSVPLGALVFAALPPAWDFATSGLDNGLVCAWLGASWLALALRASRWPTTESGGGTRPDRPLWLPVLLGLGPLVRPDCAIESPMPLFGGR